MSFVPASPEFEEAAARQTALASELQRSLNALRLELPASVHAHHSRVLGDYLASIQRTVEASRAALPRVGE